MIQIIYIGGYMHMFIYIYKIVEIISRTMMP